MKTLYIAPLMLALAGCASKPPQLSEGAQLIMDKPLPTTEPERIRQCAGTMQMLESFDILQRMQGQPKEAGGYKWAIRERARLSKCTQAEMATPDMGFWEKRSR